MTTHYSTAFNVPPCRNCGVDITKATEIERAPVSPGNGDFDLCFNCGVLSVIEIKDDVYDRRDPTIKEMTDMMNGQPDDWAKMEQIQAAIKQRGRKY